jgi:hypothetical protein
MNTETSRPTRWRWAGQNQITLSAHFRDVTLPLGIRESGWVRKYELFFGDTPKGREWREKGLRGLFSAQYMGSIRRPVSNPRPRVVLEKFTIGTNVEAVAMRVVKEQDRGQIQNWGTRAILQTQARVQVNGDVSTEAARNNLYETGKELMGEEGKQALRSVTVSKPRGGGGAGRLLLTVWQSQQVAEEITARAQRGELTDIRSGRYISVEDEWQRYTRTHGEEATGVEPATAARIRAKFEKPTASQLPNRGMLQQHQYGGGDMTR